jgi:acyl carrier protein
MTKSQFLSKLETLLDADVGSIQETDRLSIFDRWDSLTMMGFIAMVDEELGVAVPANKLMSATSVTDLVSIVQDRLAG